MIFVLSGCGVKLMKKNTWASSQLEVESARGEASDLKEQNKKLFEENKRLTAELMRPKIEERQLALKKVIAQKEIELLQQEPSESEEKIINVFLSFQKFEKQIMSNSMREFVAYSRELKFIIQIADNDRLNFKVEVYKPPYRFIEDCIFGKYMSSKNLPEKWQEIYNRLPK